MTMFLAVIGGLASPLKSSHILWINLITDSLPALALGIDENDGAKLMRIPPRKSNESLFANGGLTCTCFYGILIALISLTAFFAFPYMLLQKEGLPVTLESLSTLLRREDILMRAQTYAFTVLGMSQLFHAVGMRDIHTSVFRMGYLRNKLMLAAFVIGFLLQFGVTEIPFLILAAFPLLAHELLVLLGRGGKEKD